MSDIASATQARIKPNLRHGSCERKGKVADVGRVKRQGNRHGSKVYYWLTYENEDWGWYSEDELEWVAR